MKIINRRNNFILYLIILSMTIVIIATTIFFRYVPSWGKILIFSLVPLTSIASILFSLFLFKKTFKILFMILACLTVFSLMYLILEVTGFMEIFHVPEGCIDTSACISENMRAYLSQKGKWSTLVFILLQFLQTAILPIPSTIVTAAGALFYSQAYGDMVGSIVSSIYSIIGILMGSFLAFFLGKKYGVKLVVWIVGKDALKKVLTMLKGRDILVLTLMFILPFFPDDVLCFVAGMSSMTWLYFTIVILISRLLVVFGTSFLITIIPFNTWWGISIWIVFCLVVVIVFYFAAKKGDAILRFFRHKIFKLEDKKKSNFNSLEKLLDNIENENVDNIEKQKVINKKIE